MRAFNSLDETSRLISLRLDVTWLSWFAQKLLLPLSEIDGDIENSLGQYVEGVPEHYCRIVMARSMRFRHTQCADLIL